jgi:hypothetical protein
MDNQQQPTSPKEEINLYEIKKDFTKRVYMIFAMVEKDINLTEIKGTILLFFPHSSYSFLWYFI